MTAKTVRNKRVIDCTRGVSREQRAINRRNNLQSSLVSSRADATKWSGNKRVFNRWLKWMLDRKAADEAYHKFEENLSAIAIQRFGEPFRDREVSDTAFEESSFGEIVKPGQITCRIRKHLVVDFSSLVVSFALFDGDKMLFACSGMALPDGRTKQRLTRFVTSAHLVREFNNNRNKDDKLRIAVRLPNNTVTDGFLGLHDEDIAIVTCLDLNVYHIDLDCKATPHPGDSVQAFGRAFNSGSLMALGGSVPDSRSRTIFPKKINTWFSSSQVISKAVLGGPLLWSNEDLGSNEKILGINLDITYDPGDAHLRCTFLPMDLLVKRLKHFQILNPKKLHFRGYKLPKGVSSVIPSGFMDTICKLKSCDYPIPPPLVLELNGQLLNHFEECFGELLPYKGFPYGDPPGGTGERVWYQFPKQVVTDVSRRVVSLASFNGYVRSFACTGLLIKWHGGKAKHTVILTSASLVRDRSNEDIIDNSLTIEVFLPPNQRAGGTLEFYNLDYNIAIVSLKKNFNAICPDDIFMENAQKSSKQENSQNSSIQVVAIGRDAKFGILMATSGAVKRGNKGCKLDCKDVQLSTCKIKKSGIGGPLINLDGNFVGMNFYDGSSVTPFLPRHKIVKIIRGMDSLPSECGYNHPMPVDVGGGANEGIQKNRWPVPKAYWYHGTLDESIYDLGRHIGRRLN